MLASSDPAALGGIAAGGAALITAAVGAFRNRRTDNRDDYEALLSQFKALLDAEREQTDRQVRALEGEIEDLREHVTACESGRSADQAAWNTERRELLARAGLG